MRQVVVQVSGVRVPVHLFLWGKFAEMVLTRNALVMIRLAYVRPDGALSVSVRQPTKDGRALRHPVVELLRKDDVKYIDSSFSVDDNVNGNAGASITVLRRQYVELHHQMMKVLEELERKAAHLF